MQIGGRDLKKLFRATAEKRHYIALRNMFHVYENPLTTLINYLFHTGEYPRKIKINTKSGKIELNLFSKDDLLTVNEIFCRNDYPARRSDRIIVDFGSNIGISAAYFLNVAPEAHIYLFEPLSMNLLR